MNKDIDVSKQYAKKVQMHEEEDVNLDKQRRKEKRYKKKKQKRTREDWKHHIKTVVAVIEKDTNAGKEK